MVECGLLPTGVVEGRLEEAGLQGGSVIVELAGKTIRDVYDCTYALDVVKVGT